MRVSVTVKAACYPEMRAAGVALAALREEVPGFLHLRRMSDMAARTSYDFVLPAGGCHGGRRMGVALHAVFVRQRRLFRGTGRA